MIESDEGGMRVGDITIKAAMGVTKQTHSTPVQNTHDITDIYKKLKKIIVVQ